MQAELPIHTRQLAKRKLPRVTVVNLLESGRWLKRPTGGYVRVIGNRTFRITPCPKVFTRWHLHINGLHTSSGFLIQLLAEVNRES